MNEIPDEKRICKNALPPEWVCGDSKCKVCIAKAKRAFEDFLKELSNPQ